MATAKKPRGTPPDVKAARCDEIISRVSMGEPLAAVCRDIGCGLSTFYDWMEADSSLAGRFARARKAGFDIIAEGTLAIADEPPPLTPLGTTDGGAIQHAKLRIETRLKLLAKWDPKRYGDKLELSGDQESPLQVQVIKRTIIDPKDGT